jgi:hypothetical protein
MYDGDIEFVEKYFNKGIDYILTNICGFDPEVHQYIFKKCNDYSEEISGQ